MKLFKKITALLLTAVLTFGGTASAFAESSETAIIDTTEKPETAVIDSDKNPETGVINEGDGADSSGVDLSDIDYTPIDLTDYIRWNGKTEMEQGKNYYVDGTVKITK